MIVAKNELEIGDNQKIYYRGELFSGIFIDVNEGSVISKERCKDGIIVGKYSLPFPRYSSSELEIDSTYLESEEEPFNYQGRPFFGVSYSFSGESEFLIRQFENGEEVSTAKYIQGVLKSLEHIEPDESLVQEYVWDDSQNIEHVSIYSEGKFQMALHFDEGRRLSLLTIRGNYFGEVGEMESTLLSSQVFKDISFLGDVRAGSYLRLSGLNITDDVLTMLYQGNGLSDVNRLEVYGTSISNSCFQKIKLDGLSELHIESEVLSNESIQQYKLEHPKCYVRFNKKEVTV